MKILVWPPYGFETYVGIFDSSDVVLPRVGEYVLCNLNAEGLKNYPNKSTINNQLKLIVDRVSHDLFSGEVVIDVVKD